MERVPYKNNNLSENSLNKTVLHAIKIENQNRKSKL